MIKQISEAEISLLLKKNKNKTKDEINIQTKYIFIVMQPGGWIYNDGKKKKKLHFNPKFIRYFIFKISKYAFLFLLWQYILLLNSIYF